MKKIQFIAAIHGLSDVSDPPYPAVKGLPEWYKKMTTFSGPDQKLTLDATAQPNITAKKCMPLRDSMTAGYLIPTPMDVMVSQDGDFIQWTSSLDPATTHLRSQVDGFHLPEGFNTNTVFKWYNPWIVKTPPGYSCLFVQPFHRTDLPFYIFPGIVDTDIHTVGVNFPFLMKEGFNGVIEKGTPMVQVIPFKRENWASEVVREVPDNVRAEEAKIRTKITSFYSSFVWRRKEYK